MLPPVSRLCLNLRHHWWNPLHRLGTACIFGVPSTTTPNGGRPRSRCHDSVIHYLHPILSTEFLAHTSKNSKDSVPCITLDTNLTDDRIWKPPGLVLCVSAVTLVCLHGSIRTIRKFIIVESLHTYGSTCRVDTLPIPTIGSVLTMGLGLPSLISTARILLEPAYLFLKQPPSSQT
ncbi:hypothetical protein K439DRAFT_1634583 [Ramaria rubella]|nr:hypothetical protein K439DRAFT_1634583 [Ramaria rubella]